MLSERPAELNDQFAGLSGSDAVAVVCYRGENFGFPIFMTVFDHEVLFDCRKNSEVAASPKDPIQKWHTTPKMCCDNVLSEARRFGQGKHDDSFAGHGTDVVVHAQHLHAGDFVDQRFQHRASQLQQLLAYLFDEIPSRR